MIKILLTSDIHLGIGEDISTIPESARMNTFRNICALAREHDLFLIAGDLFHDGSISDELVADVANEFSSLRENNTEIVCTPGEYELIKPVEFSKLNASHVFTGNRENEAYKFHRDGQNIYIYGFPATNKEYIPSLKKIDGEGFHIGLFHADFSLNDEHMTSNVYVLQKRDIRSLNLDFYALGHYHYFKLFKFHNQIVGAYPGSPEATHPAETGDRYVLSISVEDNEIYQIKRLVVNSLRIIETRFDCSAIASFLAVLENLDKNKSLRTIHNITLTGKRDFLVSRAALDGLRQNYHSLNFTDASIPSRKVLIEEFIHENSIRGEFFKHLKEKIDSGGIPSDLNQDVLVNILHSISRTGNYAPEDWLC